MIERLLSTLHLFADHRAGTKEAGDFLDAYRLIVDCPQYELGATARAALDEMREAAEVVAGGSAGAAGDAEVAARRALAALGEGESP